MNYKNNNNNNNNNNNFKKTYQKEPKESYEPIDLDGTFLYDKKYQHYTVHCQKKPYEVYIGRKNPKVPSTGAPDEFKWGNPFVVGKDGTRNQVVKKYRDWIFSPEQDHLFQLAKKELKGKTLACWCSPLNCHGFILAEIANSDIQNNSSSSSSSSTTINNIDDNQLKNDEKSNTTTTTSSSSSSSNENESKSAPLSMANIINKNNKYTQSYNIKNNKNNNNADSSFPPLSSSPSSTSPSLSSTTTTTTTNSNKTSFAEMMKQNSNNNINININNNNNNNINMNSKRIINEQPSLESENDFPSLGSKKKK